MTCWGRCTALTCRRWWVSRELPGGVLWGLLGASPGACWETCTALTCRRWWAWDGVAAGARCCVAILMVLSCGTFPR